MTKYTAEETAANRKTWTDALRSGEFMQGTAALRESTPNGDTYCCLGVACELAVDAGIIKRESLGYSLEPRDNVYHHNSLPPLAVVEWLGLADEQGTLVDAVYKGEGEDEEFGTTLPELNDYTGLTFAEIADVIDDGGVKLAEVS